MDVLQERSLMIGHIGVISVSFIRVDENGGLARSSELMKTCHNLNIIVQITGVYASSLNGNSYIPNKTLANITISNLLKSSHKKELWCFAYQYSIWLFRRTDNRFRGDVPYFLWDGTRP